LRLNIDLRIAVDVKRDIRKAGIVNALALAPKFTRREVLAFAVLLYLVGDCCVLRFRYVYLARTAIVNDNTGCNRDRLVSNFGTLQKSRPVVGTDQGRPGEQLD